MIVDKEVSKNDKWCHKYLALYFTVALVISPKSMSLTKSISDYLSDVA